MQSKVNIFVARIDCVLFGLAMGYAIALRKARKKVNILLTWGLLWSIVSV